jgi:hypothetical protein
MKEGFCSQILNIYPNKTDCVDKLSEELIYVYDCENKNKTIFTSELPIESDKSFKIKNENKTEVVHICIDGGLIEKGKDYIGDKGSHGRFDCMVLDNNKLLLLELKMNVISSSSNTLYKRFYEGMEQIQECYLYFKGKFIELGDDVNNYFDNGNIISVIGFKEDVKKRIRRNTQLDTKRERFRINTGIKIDIGSEYKF